MPAPLKEEPMCGHFPFKLFFTLIFFEKKNPDHALFRIFKILATVLVKKIIYMFFYLIIYFLPKNI